jgi:hypothetical protein
MACRQVDAPETMLTAESVFGALRGLETLSQLLERVEPPPEPPPDPSPSASNQASWRSSTEVQVSGAQTRTHTKTVNEAETCQE